MAKTLQELQDLLSFKQPEQFNMTDSDEWTAQEETPESDPMAFAPAEGPPTNNQLASQEEIAKIQSMPLPEAQQSQLDKQDQMVEQEITEADAMPTEDPVMSRRKNLLAELQKNRNTDNTSLNYLQAGNQIAQGLAQQYGGKIGDGSDIIKSLRDQTDQPIKDYKEGIENEENDPESDVSKFMREQAYATLAKISPDKKYNLENMTANQLKKSMGKLLGGSGSNQKTKQQAQFIEKTSGDPIVFDPNEGKYTNAITGKPVASGGIVRPIAYGDVFGNRSYVSPSGNVEVMSSKRPNESPAAMDAKVSEFKPDKEQRGALDKEKDRMDSLTKTINEKVSAANRILGALDGDSKQALAVIKTQMPRLAGEVGNLNQSEQEVWGGSQAWLDRLEQFVSTGIGSELTEDNKQELRKVLGPFLKDAVTSRNSIMDASSNSLAEIYNIPPEFTRKAYGVLKPVTKRQEEIMAGKVETPQQETDLVTIKGPSGTVVKMKKDAADKYLKKPGYKLVD